MLPALLLAAASFLSPADADARPAPTSLPFHVVVNRDNPVDSVSRKELSAIFMRRTRSWPDGVDILPVDQPARSALREDFSRAIHGKSVAFVTRYWQRVIFSGRGIPPVEEATDAAVLELVGRDRGAVGYVDAATPLAAGVKAIAVTP